VEHAVLDSERAGAAVALLGLHEARLRRIARRSSICADDADDALQRAIEVLLTKAPPLEAGRLIAWMTVVTKREAMAVRRSREGLFAALAPGSDPGPVRDPLDAVASDGPGPAECSERAEAVFEARAALAALKPAERVAILLQASGYSYAEICALRGWSYTKVNRSLAEGRARLRARGAIS
jgi:RNA polymerase sigma factor (sigma-70 family)